MKLMMVLIVSCLNFQLVTELTPFMISCVTDFFKIISALANTDYDGYLFTKTYPFEAILEPERYSPYFCVSMNAFDTSHESFAQDAVDDLDTDNDK